MFVCLLSFSLPTLQARDVGAYGTTAKCKAKDANVAAINCFINAVAVVKSVKLSLNQKEAAPHDVAILTKTPAVEVRAYATVEGSRYQRLCKNYNIPLKYKSPARIAFPLRYSHIDPGLRGC